LAGVALKFRVTPPGGAESGNETLNDVDCPTVAFKVVGDTLNADGAT
jgi:hypothetical protein